MIERGKNEQGNASIDFIFQNKKCAFANFIIFKWKLELHSPKKSSGVK